MSRKVPGRKARVGYDTIFNTLKNIMIFTENGELKKRNDPAWKEAYKLLPDMKEKNLYLFVFQDRHDIKTNLLKHFNITPTKLVVKGGQAKKKETAPKYNEIWDDYNYYDKLDTECDNVENELNTLIYMKGSKEYKDVINKICVYPFSIYYWIPAQVELWTELIKIKSTVSLIVLDQVISNIKENFETSNIVVYALAVRFENTIILLAQMMCDQTSLNELNNFFTNWLQCNAPPPPELVVYYSHNLLNAASLAFNYCRFDEYNLRCYKYILNESFNLPATLIQIDLVSLVKVINDWPNFQNILQTVKDFYLCSIMYLSTVNSLEEFRETVVTILALCQSPFESLEIEARKESLWPNLITDTIQELNQQYIHFVSGKYGTKCYSFLNVTENLDFNDPPQEIYEFINQLKLQALEICDFNIDTEKSPNNYYCPVILTNLMNLFSEFPSWTNLINNKKYWNLVSFCATEHLASLKELKEPMKPTKFINYHLDKIKSTMKKVERFIKRSTNDKVLVDNSKKSLIILPQADETICTGTFEIVEENIKPLVFEEDRINLEPEVQAEINILQFKNKVLSTINSLVDFDEYFEDTLKKQIHPGQEEALTKALLDCSAEIKNYEIFCKTIIKKLLSISEAFTDSFRQLFVECYNNLVVLNKQELKSVSKFFAHLITSDCISWKVLSNLALSEKDTDVSKRTFIKVLLKQMIESMGESKLIKKFEDKKYKSAVAGLFPSKDSNEARFAYTFYEAVGLKNLADYFINRNVEKLPNLKRSSSNSSVNSTSSTDDDFYIEVKVSKKRRKSNNDSKFKTKKIVMKK